MSEVTGAAARTAFVCLLGASLLALSSTPVLALQFFGNFNGNANTTDGTAQNEDIITINNVLDPVDIPETLGIELDMTPLDTTTGTNLDAVDVLGGGDYLVSFRGNETINDVIGGGPALTVQDEDIVLIRDTGSGLEAALLVDVTPIAPNSGGGGNRNVQVDAVHRLSDTEVLVSFERDHSNLGLPGSRFNVREEDLVRLTFDANGNVTAASLFLEDPLRLLGNTDLNGFTLGPDGLDGNFQYGSAGNNGGTWSDEDVLLITIAENQAPGLLSTADFIVIGASRAIDVGGLETAALDGVDFLGIGVPEPAPMILISFGVAGIILTRRLRASPTVQREGIGMEEHKSNA